jgi:hypothetical protein
LRKLRSVILGALTWLVRTDLKRTRILPAVRSLDRSIPTDDAPISTSRHNTGTPLIKMNSDHTYNRSCYATLALWLVMKECPAAITPHFKSSILSPELSTAYKSVEDRAKHDESTPKNDILQWLHLTCFYLVCCEKIGIDNQGQQIDGFQVANLPREGVQEKRKEFEKLASRLKAIHNDYYSVEHEELDRVVFLGRELGFKKFIKVLGSESPHRLALSKLEQTQARIAHRQRTSIFNPGPRLGKRKRISPNGPWELICTNHEAALRVAEELDDVRDSRDQLFEFLLSDYSFMASWDHSDSNMLGRWWDMEPSSIICATLIDLKFEGETFHFE